MLCIEVHSELIYMQCSLVKNVTTDILAVIYLQIKPHSTFHWLLICYCKFFVLFLRHIPASKSDTSSYKVEFECLN